MINSVGSGIGSAAVQLAKLAGAFVIGNALERRQARAGDGARAWTSGSTTQTQDVVARGHGADGRRGVDVVYEHVGGELFQKGLDSLAKDGRLVTCGGHSGEVVPFDIIPFFRTQKQRHRLVRLHRGEVEKCFDLAARGRITAARPRDVPARPRRSEAMEPMERREHFGKIVLTP